MSKTMYEDALEAKVADLKESYYNLQKAADELLCRIDALGIFEDNNDIQAAIAHVEKFI